MFTLVRDVTTPHDVSKEQAIEQVKRRYIERQVNIEAYLLKATDVLDNTTDLLDCYQVNPQDPGVIAHMTMRKWTKYSGYADALAIGWGSHRENDTSFISMDGSLQQLVGQVRNNLQEIGSIVGVESGAI